MLLQFVALKPNPWMSLLICNYEHSSRPGQHNPCLVISFAPNFNHLAQSMALRIRRVSRNNILPTSAFSHLAIHYTPAIQSTIFSTKASPSLASATTPPLLLLSRPLRRRRRRHFLAFSRESWKLLDMHTAYSSKWFLYYVIFSAAFFA